MVKGLGIDSVEIERFKDWSARPHNELKKIFSDQEIEYCLKNKQKSAERFAARFAAKEALFKALSQILPNHNIPFLTVCKNAYVNHEKNGNPHLSMAWQNIIKTDSTKTPYQSIVSITHTKHTATAIVIVENQ